ncbi:MULTISPECIES: endonuclease/exonuclease/phosphatase family protein [unclassified Cellulophaga]|uniref:endonuclease/exonuclease/phosphatase family protein n=1 Tax=unclassified Cellulophaga TaxID=2634405 RepID=UPI0026E323C4|nr:MULTISPECIES: endonuclease/exonuclease/phosphatase family protein [unclassified Cellulophaga]MDO6492023.1 endonuclease/exonuclease/phosphatase family protein [Cellulophaga sp. 2_MG-2023]MDO6495817.1 endonuclease/exonuclease/phosphatase family protein [Cellulophaga sp. 3_MG-2023]
MKKQSFFNRIVFVLNYLFALLLCVSYLAPYISVKVLPFLSVFSLSLPLLVLVNVIFCLYWLLAKNRRILLSALVLILGYFLIDSFFKFSFKSEEASSKDLKVMSYNTRGFNKYEWSSDKSLGDKIIDFVLNEDPDVVCFQEFSRVRYHQLKHRYKYNYVAPGFYVNKVNQAIYSKYPIVNTGELPFKHTNNIASFADILYKNDTVRVYNLHLESLKVVPDIETISNEESSKLYGRITKSFKKQQDQAKIVQEHRKKVAYKTIVCGDFNNNQYSNVYRTIKGDLQDTFNEKGSAYGRTYNFKYYPVRIDFILTSKEFEVIAHKNYDNKLSDHFPVMAVFSLN